MIIIFNKIFYYDNIFNSYTVYRIRCPCPPYPILTANCNYISFLGHTVDFDLSTSTNESVSQVIPHAKTIILSISFWWQSSSLGQSSS